MTKPLFIAFEGIDGAGKTTQALKLYQRLCTRLGERVKLIHEPGSTRLGERIADLLKHGSEVGISPWAELFLFAASRAQLIQEVIRPSLAQGHSVVCDRYTDSTLAYQGYGRGLDEDLISSSIAIATGGLKPDLIVLLDLPVATGLARKKGAIGFDRFEQEELAFHQRVRDGYLRLSKAEPERWLVVDGLLSPEAIACLVWERVNQLLA